MKHATDTIFKAICWAGVSLGLVLAAALILELAFASSDVWRTA